eukprot:477169-Pelagomonas_calceolata.AAC.1
MLAPHSSYAWLHGRIDRATYNATLTCLKMCPQVTKAGSSYDGPALDIIGHDIEAPSPETPFKAAASPRGKFTHVQTDPTEAKHACEDGALLDRRSIPVQTEWSFTDGALLLRQSIPVHMELSCADGVRFYKRSIMTQTEHPQVPAPCWESLAGLMEAIPLALVVVSRYKSTFLVDVPF